MHISDYPNLSFTFSFERELKNKLAEKTKGAQSEQQVLKKAFKYFDLNDNGTVEPEEFAKAIEKIGIQIPTKQVSCFQISIFLFRRGKILKTESMTRFLARTYRYHHQNNPILKMYIFNCDLFFNKNKTCALAVLIELILNS